jgi:hypothetical protein
MDWQVQGVGDFDGDGKADVLLQNSNGATAIWFYRDATAGAASHTWADSNWQIGG